MFVPSREKSFGCPSGKAVAQLWQAIPVAGALAGTIGADPSRLGRGGYVDSDPTELASVVASSRLGVHANTVQSCDRVAG